MSANFVSASSKRLVNSAAPLISTGYPFSAGLWVMPVSGTAGTHFALVDTASANNFLTIEQTTNQFRAAAAGGGTTNVATITTTFTTTLNKWHFLLARFISSTNRRISCLFPSGTIQHANTVTSRAPTSLDTISIGSNEGSAPSTFFDGNLAEVWYTNSDIQPDGLQLDNALLWRLAYNGPFSESRIAKDIIEYHSFRTHLSSNSFSNEEDILPILGEVLTNTNGVTLGPHPPLLYEGRREPHLVYPWAKQKLFIGMVAGGIDTSAPRSGTSTGVAVVSGKIAVVNEHRGVSTGVAVDTGRKAVQDAKCSTVTGVAVVAGTSSFINANWSQPGTSVGKAVVTAKDASQDAKRSTVVGKAVVSGTVAQQTQISRSGASTGIAVDTGRKAAQDAKRSTVLAKAVVTGVGTSVIAGGTQPRSGTSVGLAIVNARTAWMDEIAGHAMGLAIVNGIATFTDESGGTGAFFNNPMIAYPGRLMNR